MAHWKLRVYLALRLLQVLGCIAMALVLVGLVLILVGSSEPRGGGTLWIDFVRSKWLPAVVALVGSVVVVAALGIATDRLGKRWKREIGKYR